MAFRTLRKGKPQCAFVTEVSSGEFRNSSEIDIGLFSASILSIFIRTRGVGS